MNCNVSQIPTPINFFQSWVCSQGLTVEDVAIMKLRLVSASDASAFLGFYPQNDVCIIPYPGESYARARPMVDVVKGQAKYLSPKGSGVSPPYLPALLPWTDIKVDVSKPLVITEGEVKAYWGCKTGIPTIGIGGVTMQSTLFDGRIEWSRREVFICFDHDGLGSREFKPGVAHAMGKLSSRLVSCGAKVKILYLSDVVKDKGIKWGLDDYLRAGGSWVELLATASTPPAWCSMLAELLESCVYVVGTNHTHVYNLNNGSRKSPDDFHDAHISLRRLGVDDRGKVVQEQISHQWIRSPDRLTAVGYCMDPLKPNGYVDGWVNLWKGYPTFEGTVLPDKLIMWQTFMEGLFGEHWKWVGLWVGHLLNKPQERSNQAVMLVTSVQGIGKSLFGDIIRDLCGPHGLEGSSSRIFHPFNSMEEGKTFIVVNELDVKFSSKESQLNDLLSAETMSIEQKGKDVIILPNLRRWFFTANASAPCRLSADQRRILVINPPRVVADTRGEWGDWVRNEVAAIRRSDDSLSSVRWWFDDLWAREGKDWDSCAPVPITQAALDAAEASKTDSQIAAEYMYEFMKDGIGWGAVHPDLRKQNAKVWGEVTLLVRAHGGRCLRKSVRDEGRVREYGVFDLSGKLVGAHKESGGAYANVTSDQVKESALAMAGEYVKVMSLLGQKRFGA